MTRSTPSDIRPRMYARHVGRFVSIVRESELIAHALVLLAMTLYAVSCYRFGAERYDIYRAGVDDGIFMQVLNSAFDGFHARVEGNYNHLAVHFSPILFLMAPLVIATKSVYTLVALQSLAGALVALPVYLLARRRMPVFYAAVCASVALLYPPLAGVETGDFHEHIFTPAALAFVVWAIDARRFRSAVAFALIALSIKEDVSVVLVVDGVIAGAWFASRADRPRSTCCWAVAALAAATFAGYFAILRPALHVPFAYWSFHFYLPNGAQSSPAGFVGPSDPIRLRYLVAAFGQLSFLPLASVGAVLCLPGFLEVLASREAITMNMGTAYAAVWIPFMLAAYVFAIGKMTARAPRLALWALVLTTLVARHALLVDDPFARYYYAYRAENDADRTVGAFLASLPPNAEISLLYDVYAHAGTDPNACIYPVPARYMLLDTLHESEGTAGQKRLVAALLADGTYHRLPAPAGLVFIERVAR